MHQSIPTHQNRYIKQTHPHPHHLSAPSFHPFHPQIPAQHFNQATNQIFQAPQSFHSQKPPMHAPVNAQRWEDIIPQPVVNHPVMRPNEQTLTFRNNSTGKKPSNKELLAKADLILAKSPPKQNIIIQANRSSANKEQPRASYSSQQPAQTLPTFSSPRPLHLETFTSPVRNVPMSHPASIARSHAEFPPHAFVSPPREQIIHSLPTEYHTLPTEYHSGPRQQFLPPPHHPHHFIGPNIIRQEVRPERIHYQIPAEVQHMHPPVVHERPVPLLKPAPQPGKVHYLPIESAQFPQSEFSEIRRDFVQLRLDTQPQEFFETVTPTPFRTITEEPVMGGALEFVPEITDDEESGYVQGLIPDSDRQSHGRYRKPMINPVQRKLFAEPGFEKRQQPGQPEIGRRFNSGQQSGGSTIRKDPSRKNSSGNTGQFARVNRDTQPVPQPVSTVRDTMGSNRRSSTSEYIDEKPRGTLLERKPRETTPEKRQRESIAENPAEKKSVAYGPRSENVNTNVKKEEDYSKSRIYSANSESVNLRKEDNLKDSKTWIYSANSESVNSKKEEIPKDSKTWIYSPSSERVKREESPESRRQDREAKYTNKVEVSLQGTNKKGNDRNRKVMKKVEQVLM